MTLKQARIRAQLTQKEAADKIGKTQNTINRYENGSINISVLTFIKLCHLYGVSVNDIDLTEGFKNE